MRPDWQILRIADISVEKQDAVTLEPDVFRHRGAPNYPEPTPCDHSLANVGQREIRQNRSLP
jgi:hypothetical protein